MRNTFSKRWRVILASIALTSAVTGPTIPVFAGSISSDDYYAGDVNGLALPEGTFIVLDYNQYAHADAVINNGLLNKLGNPREVAANVEAYIGFTRFIYFASLWDHPLVLEAAVPYGWIQNANFGNMPVFNATGQGLGPQPKTSGVIDPTFFFTYGLIVEPKTERFLGLTNYFYFPVGEFNKFNTVNIASPHQFTWVPQLEYAEGLEKFSPILKSFWIDVVANASIHSDGDPNFAIAGVGQFNNLTQDNSYNIKTFLRYVYTQGGLLAVGVEKSWGGAQIMSGGVLGAQFGPTQWLNDDYLKGHIQAVFPIFPDFHIGADITHDFQREGGLREDFTAEVRLTKFFIPTQPLPTQSLK
jgi:hypothetical protein